MFSRWVGVIAICTIQMVVADSGRAAIVQESEAAILVSVRHDLTDADVLALFESHGAAKEAVQATRLHGTWRVNTNTLMDEARSKLISTLASHDVVNFVSPARVEEEGWLTGLGATVLFEAKPSANPEAIIESAKAVSGIDLAEPPRKMGSDRAFSVKVASENRALVDAFADRLSADADVLWAAAQTFKVQDAGLVYIVSQEAVHAQRYVDGSRAQLPSEERWRLMCGSQPIEFNAFRSMVNEIRRAPQAVVANVEGGGAAMGSPFNLVFVTSNLPAGAAAAIAAVEAYLEGLIFDPITVTINLGFASMSPGVLGATSSSYTSDSYMDVRAGLVAGMDFDDTIQSNLPLGNTFPVRYNGNSDTVTNEAVVFVTRANYRATIGSVTGTAGNMTFNTNFSWDYSPPSIAGGTYCFQSVLAHEVGHALGFVSGADFRINDSELLDLYRFQRSDGAFNYNPETLAEFTSTPRMVDQDAPLVTDDVVSELISAEHRMSDGNPNQASHFREGIGAVMDPTLAAGQTFYSEFYRVGDQDMFDAIGYDIFRSTVPLFAPDGDSQGSQLAKNRAISFVVPASGTGQDTAVRVLLSSLHHPAGPPNAPDFSSFEGQYRYLNSFKDGANNPVFDCPDSVAFGTTYKCATLGCTPEYRDWATALAAETVHVFGSAVVPSSVYSIVHLASSCAGNEAACTEGWGELIVTTERWGNVDASPVNGAASALDLGLIVDKVKDVSGAMIESRSQLQPATPDPLGAAVSAQDIGRCVDAVKGNPYPYPIGTCP